MPDVINHKNSDKLYSNIEIITMALYLLGGDSHYIDTEDTRRRILKAA